MMEKSKLALKKSLEMGVLGVSWKNVEFWLGKQKKKGGRTNEKWRGDSGMRELEKLRELSWWLGLRSEMRKKDQEAN